MPSPSHNVLVTELPDGESVLLDLDSEKYFGLNRLGTAVWAALSEGENLDALIAATSVDTGVSPDTIGSDIADLIAELRSRGLVVEGAR